MSKEITQVSIGALEIGMFVCELDIPWSATTYPLQGFMIKSEQDIYKLSQQCKYVLVDKELSKNKKATFSVGDRKEKIQKSFNKKLKTYKDTEQWDKEYPKAKKAIYDLSSSIQNAFKDYLTTKTFNIEKLKESVTPMIDSISRNPDACIWLARMKKEDNYIYEHSLSSSIWAVALGRQLGLDKNDLKSLAIGALLLDIGKLEVDPSILHAKRKLNPKEFEAVKKHVSASLNLIKNTKGLNKNIISMIAEHHERYNGDGYPQGLKGEDIHIYARIAAIVDSYDAITSNRPYAKALSPSEAIKRLYQWRDSLFQSELIEEFIQAIGIYPAGSLVELSSGEIAIVLAEYRSRRLRPEVMLLLDKNKKPVKDSIIIKLFETTHSDDGNKLDILCSHEPNAFGIKMDSINL
jgi:HD-GYP domain-containing protein (c-di-GMP phosphodiesterase class II)